MKKTLLKVFAICCALSLLLSGLTGCKKDDPEKTSGKSATTSVKTTPKSSSKASTSAKSTSTGKTSAKGSTQDDDPKDPTEPGVPGPTEPNDPNEPGDEPTTPDEESVDLGGITITVMGQGQPAGPFPYDMENPRHAAFYEAYRDAERKYNCIFDVQQANINVTNTTTKNVL